MGTVIVKNLGTGQSFDLKSLYPNDYKNFTDNNFFVTAVSKASGTDQVTIATDGATSYLGFIGKIYKSYNSSTGVLTIYNYIQSERLGTIVKANVKAWYVSDPSQLISLGSGKDFNLRNYTVNGSTLYQDFYATNSLDLESFTNFLISGTSQFYVHSSRTIAGTYKATGYTGVTREDRGNGTVRIAYKGYHSDLSSEQLVNANVYFCKTFKIKTKIDSNVGGTVTGAGTYMFDKTAKVVATPADNYRFDGWYEDGTLVSSNKTYSITHLKADHTLTAKFVPKYTVSIEIEGQEYCQSATWSWANNLTVSLKAVPNENNGQFVAWYAKSDSSSVFISNKEDTVYSVTGNTIFVAEFKQKYTVTSSSVGNGSIDISRSDEDKNEVTFTAVPQSNWAFEKFVINPGITYGVSVKSVPWSPVKLQIRNGTNDYEPYYGEFDSSQRHTIVLDTYRKRYAVDGNSRPLTDELTFSGSDSQIWLFAYRNYNYLDITDQNAFSNPSIFKLYSFKVYVQDNIYREFVPVHCVSKNVNGLFDLVKRTFYSNEMAIDGDISDFTAGPQTGTVYDTDYAELEYIQSDGTQAIATGIYPRTYLSELRLECDAQVPDAYKGNEVTYFGYSSYEYYAHNSTLKRFLTDDITIVAYFIEDPKVYLFTETNIPNFDVYASKRSGYPPFTSKLIARPYPGYNFIRWDDGSTDSTRTITVSEDTYISATYWKEFDDNGTYQYRCYIKDQLKLADTPKAFMRVESFDIKRDLLTTANSSVTVYKTDLDSDVVNNGDILILYDPKGTVLYQGVITSREERTFRCSQIQSFYKGEWVYDTGETPPESFDTSWNFKVYPYIDIDCPTEVDFYGKTPTKTVGQVPDNYMGRSLNEALGISFTSSGYSAQGTIYIWTSRPFSIAMTYQSHQSGTFYLNDELVGQCPWQLNNYNQTTIYHFTCNFVKGRNKMVFCYRAKVDQNDESSTYNPFNENGGRFYMTEESFDPYDPTSTYKVGDFCVYTSKLYKCTTAITTPESWNSSHWERSTMTYIKPVSGTSTTHNDVAPINEHPYVLGITSVDQEKDQYLENSLKNILFDYSKGLLVGSDYVDKQVQNRFGGMINYKDFPDGSHIVAGDGNGVGTITATLVTAQLGDTMDFEKFIYWLYECYGIIFEFDIAFSGASNYVYIRTSPYDSMTVGNNTHAIKDISPIETMEETNRLVIFSSEGEYRRTVILKKNNDVVEDPSGKAATSDRFELTNSRIIYSDDPLEDLVAAYLPNETYNHKLSFKLILRNYIYEFNEFKLGMPLIVYYRHDKGDQDFYNSVLTGYEMRKEYGKDVTEVEFICGLVRQKLTQKLTLGRI